MIRFLSKYSPKYPRSLVYMLQASEYEFADFIKWFWRVKDFRRVEERKLLVHTLKARVLLIALWTSILVSLVLHILHFSKLAFAFYIILLPYTLVLDVLVINFLLKFVQKPIERRIISRAKAKLDRHRGIKIGIAGSYGKTTMKEILKTVLSQKFVVAATPDNKNTPLGISRFVQSLDGKEEILIFEMGEYYRGDIETLCNIVNPQIGIVTGINEAHLEKFNNLENTAATIFEIADALAGEVAKDKKPKLYINGDSRLALEKAHQYKNKDLQLSISLYDSRGVQNLAEGEIGEGEFKVEGAETGLSGTSFVLKDNKGEGIVVSSQLLGLHQVGPLSLVATIAKKLGVKTQDIEVGLKNTKAFEHRLELREEAGGMIVLDDSYNGNPDGVRAAISFLKAVRSDHKVARRFYITPGLVEAGDKVREVHIEIGRELAEAGIEKVVLIKNSVTPFIEEGLKAHGYSGDIVWFDSSMDCFASLPRQTVSGDLLLYQNDWPDNYS